MQVDSGETLKINSLNRRQFLKILAVGGASALAVGGGWNALHEPHMVSDTRVLLGTIISISVAVGSPDAGRAAIEACFRRIDGLENVLSRFRPGSQLSLLNREGRLDGAAPELIEVLDLAQQVSHWSGGAFDVTVKPLADRYFAAFRRGGLPATGEVDAAKAFVDYRHLSVGASRVSFDRPGMSVTLDGIAKGYIVEQGVRALQERGLPNVYVEAGGDLMTAGEKAGGAQWKVGIRSPRAQQDLIGCVSAPGRAVATSGDYQQAFTADFSRHHIVDPRTGGSSAELASVTIVASNAALSDAMATAVMALGAEEGLALVRSLPGCEALVVTKDLAVRHTQGFPLLAA